MCNWKLFLFLYVLSPLFVLGQDIHFSQYLQAPLTYNPGMVGSYQGDYNVGLNWKDQWRGVNKSFQTFAFSFEHNILKNKIDNTYFTYGILAYRDVAGEVKYGTTNVMGNIGATIKISESSRLTAGIQAGLGSRGIDPSAMRWGTQYDGINYDPTISSGETSNFNPVYFLDAGMGVSYWYHRPSSSFETNDEIDVKIGFGVNHLPRPKLSFFENEDERLAMKWAVHGSVYFGIQNSNWGVEPSFIVMKQGLFSEILLGGLLKYNLSNSSNRTGYIKKSSMYFGVQNRFASPYDALIPHAGIEIQDFLIGFSYDVNISRLSPASGFRGGFEISIKYTHPDKFYYLNPEKNAPSL